MGAVRMTGVSLLGRRIADEAERRLRTAIAAGESDRAAAVRAADYLISKATRPGGVPRDSAVAVYLAMAAQVRAESWAAPKREEARPC